MTRPLSCGAGASPDTAANRSTVLLGAGETLDLDRDARFFGYLAADAILEGLREFEEYDFPAR